MYENINNELIEAKELSRKRERYLNKIKNAEANIEEEKRRLRKLYESLEKEELDVKKLEGLSIKGVFLSVLGNKCEKLSKEKREVLSAKLKYDECCSSIKLIEQEIEGYYSELHQLGYGKNSYDQLILKKEQLILASNDNYTQQIASISEEISDLEMDIKELNEAITAGNSVRQCLESAEGSLDSAENWGTWDMFGGGMISTAAKHSRIDEASEYISEAKEYYYKFKRELQDVNMKVDVQIDISSFDRFADYFFDGLIADWNVQSKIHSSQESVYAARNRVFTVVEDLKSKARLKEQEVTHLKNKIKAIIEGASD